MYCHKGIPPRFQGNDMTIGEGEKAVKDLPGGKIRFRRGMFANFLQKLVIKSVVRSLIHDSVLNEE